MSALSPQALEFLALGASVAAALALWLSHLQLVAELGRERAEARTLREHALELERALSAAYERLSHLEEALGGEGQRIEVLRAQMAELFAQIGDKQIERGTTALLSLAGERFAPFAERLAALDGKLNEIEGKREGAYARVTEQISALTQATEQLRTNADVLKMETVKLSSSLRNSGARGRWGEFQLRRVVEIAGMNEFCDFAEQLGVRDEEGAARPDMMVRVPNGQRIPVDAKAPLANYLDACEATDEAARGGALAAHARCVLTYANDLAKRDYTRFSAMSDFTIMFVPNEAALGAALLAEPELLDKAIARGVYIVGPLSLVALLRAYAAGWIVVRQEENAREIAQTARELYKRLVTFTEHLGKVGTGLRNATSAFNGAMGSYRDRLLPQARRFEDLGANEATKVLPDVGEVDVAAIGAPPS